jgi:hypothetical protein
MKWWLTIRSRPVLGTVSAGSPAPTRLVHKELSRVPHAKARWTTEEEDKLLKLGQQGITFEEMRPEFPRRSLLALIVHYRRVAPKGPSNAHVPLLRKRSQTVPRAWTPEDVDKLRKCVESNQSWDEIIPQFPERSLTALRSKYRSNCRRGQYGNIERAGKITDEDRATILRLLEQGSSMRDIERAYRYNVSKPFLTRLRRSGPSPQKGLRQWTLAEEEELIQMRLDKRL